MKKTIVILAALAAGIASATDYTLANAVCCSTTDITNISGVSGDYSFTIKLDATAMKSILGHNSDTDIRPMLVWADNKYDMGLACALNNTGFVGTYDYNGELNNLTMSGTSAENRQPMTGNGSSPATNNFADSNVTGNLVSKLSNLTGLALTFSHDDKTSSSLYVTLEFSDGSTSQLYGTSAGFKWSDGVGALTELRINETYVDNVYLYDDVIAKDNAFNLNKAAIAAPEPATATLSLLALAGLAARRRRH